MTGDFRIVPIPREVVERRLAQPGPDDRWLQVDASPGFPCRVSLADAAVGERVLAFNFEHHAVDSPYRASGPVFVRADAQTATPGVNEIPEMFHHRLLSVRGYDEHAMMIAAQTTPGSELATVVRELFGNPAIRYLHIHNAGPGCYNCAVERA